jgi:hypothetical protein
MGADLALISVARRFVRDRVRRDELDAVRIRVSGRAGRHGKSC